MLKDEKIEEYFEKKELKCLYDNINLLIEENNSKEIKKLNVSSKDIQTILNGQNIQNFVRVNVK